jgi:hypothetical protein
MAIALMAEEVVHLERLAEAGVRGINTPTPHGELQRLVDAGYITYHPVSLHGVLYLITDLGRNALADAVPCGETTPKPPPPTPRPPLPPSPLP